MALETTIVETWMQGLLAADSALTTAVGAGIFMVAAPQGYAQPYVLIVYQQGSDENTMGGRALAQPLYQVKAVGRKSDIAVLRAVADRIDALLQDTKVVFSGYQIRVQRESMIRQPEYSDGVEYRHYGGMYRCWVSLAA